MRTPSQIKVWEPTLQRAPMLEFFLDLHKGADLGFIADFATVEIHKIRDRNAVA
jgi:hypothetical protein